MPVPEGVLQAEAPRAESHPAEGSLSTIPMMRLAAWAILLLCAGAFPCAAQSAPTPIVLMVTYGPGPLEVTLEWDGGQPPFEVLRSPAAASVCLPESLLAVTDFSVWIDAPPAGAVFYKVRSPFALEAPETCNGVDDDCDGTIDNGATDCDAGACQACIDGACRSRCDACSDCVNGTCQTRCGPCTTCANGTCAACNPAGCQTCAGGACVSTCDENLCQACVGGGVCASFCDSCETCSGGICLDACDHTQCLSCQSGACRSFCDSVCQVCTPQGCADNCGPCERCLNGACQSRCDPNACEECVDGMCSSRCSPCETCVSGICEPCGT